MGVTTIHGLYAVKIGATTLGGITQQGMPTGTEVRGEPRSGEEYARILAMVAQNPRITFSTEHIATALGACGLAGVDMNTSALTLYAQKAAAGGSRAAGSVHNSYNVDYGILVPRRLTCDHQGDAALNYEALIAYDGLVDPIVLSGSAALPAASTTKERFSIGTVKIGAVTLAEVKSIEIDFGITAVQESSDSDVWPSFAYIQQTQPTITLRGISADWFNAAAVPIGGLSGSHANTIIYLRKRLDGGASWGAGQSFGYVANASAVHIKFTAAGLVYVDDGFSANNNTPGEVSLVMPLQYDGSNAPLTIDVASAIT